MFEKLGSYRKDVQWLSGIIFVFFLTLALFFGGLSQFFAPEIAKPAISGMFRETLKTMFASFDYTKATSYWQSRPASEPVEIPGVPKTGITAGEAAKLDAQGLAEKISDKLATSVYESKMDNFTPQDKQGLGPLTYLNKYAFETLSVNAHRFVIIAVLFGIIMFLFSRRFGRLVSLGLAFIISSLPPLWIFSYYIETGLNNPSTVSKASGGQSQAAVMAALINTMQPVAHKAVELAGVAFVLGGVLLLFAWFGWWIYLFAARSRNLAKGTDSMGEATAVHQTRVVELRLPYDKTFDLCLASLSEIGGKVKQQDRSLGQIVARAGFGWMSNVETVKFTVRMINGGKSQVQLSSRFTIPALWAWPPGRNFENVEKISGFLKARDQDDSTPPLPPATVGS